MSNKTIKTLTTSTAIALASISAPAFAQEATAPAKPVDSNTTATAVAKPQVKPLEKSAVEAPSTVKPAFDAQKAVVKNADAKVATAEANVKAKETAQASAEKEVATATQAVKDAEVVASQATPEKVAEVKASQAKNVETQKANQTATETVNEQIKSETKALSAEQAKVATANAKVAETAKDVKTAEKAVANAQAALDGSGLLTAQKDLKQAQADIKTATTSVEDAKTAKEKASKADASRAEAIKAAEIDVNTKNDAVKLSKAKLATATEHAESVNIKLKNAQTELTKAQDALKNVDIVDIQNPKIKLFDDERQKLGTSLDSITFKEAYEFWRENDNETTRDLLRASAVQMSGASTIKISEADKNRPIDLNNLTDDQLVEISDFYAEMLTQLNHNFGNNASKKAYVSKEILNYSKSVAKKYEERALDPDVAGHIRGGLENLTSFGDGHDFKTMYDLKYGVKRTFQLTSYEDEIENWGHLRNNLSNQAVSSVALTIANINGKYWMLTTFGGTQETSVSKRVDIPTLEKAVATAKSNVEQATTASENAKNALTKASTDYASALSLKTDAEKVLADAMAKPLQAQVAENNLRLAEIALENAKKRETKATEVVANFTASLSERKVTLLKAQDTLKEAKAVQTSASQSLADAQAELQAQEAKVDALNKQSSKLLEEKDALVKDAKKLAEQLQAYLDAPAKLATAKETKATVESKLETAKAELKTAQTALETVQAEQKAETAKLAEIEAKYAELVDLAEKAQENVVAKLPDGTVIAVPKVAPTSENLPELNLAEVAKEDAKDSVVKTLPNGTIVAVPNVAPTAEVLPEANVEELKKTNDGGKANSETYSAPAVKSTENKKPTYSRVERAKSLPNTGENSSIIMMLLGAILGVFGLVTVHRKN